MHAASLGVFGHHDSIFDLRRKVHKILSEGEFQNMIFGRWRFQQTMMYKDTGLIFDEEEWMKEWDEIVDAASVKAYNNSLEEIHVLAISYVLRRPIIVLCDDYLRNVHGELLAPISIGGVYLPFDIPPNDRFKIPLILGYNNSHFSPLISMDTASEIRAIIPLIDCNKTLLPIRYHFKPSNVFDWTSCDESEDFELGKVETLSIFNEFMRIVNMPVTVNPQSPLDLDLSNISLESEIEMHLRIENTFRGLGWKGDQNNDTSISGGFSDGQYRFLSAQLRVQDAVNDNDEMVRKFIYSVLKIEIILICFNR